MNSSDWPSVDSSQSSGRHRSRREHQHWLAGERMPLTLKVVDAGILLIFLFAPFFMAGRQALGQLVLCLLATCTAVAWCVHQWQSNRARWSFTGVEPVILLGLAAIAFQCLEISPGLMETLSPKISGMLAGWSEGSGEGTLIQETWRRISLTPHHTWSNFIVIVACSLVFLVLSQRIRTVTDISRAVAMIGLSGVLMAVFALAQFLFGNGKFFWVYDHPMTDTLYVAKGAFTNANHFANYLAMTLVAQLFLVVSQLHEQQHHSRHRSGPQPQWDSRLLLLLGAMALTGLALLLSMSRGGIVVSMGGMAIALLILWRKQLLPTRITAIIGGVAVACLAGTLLFGDLAAKMIEQNFNELTSSDIQELDKNDGRRRIWEANIAGFQEFPILGTGLGSHPEVYWLWFNHPADGKEYSHAESGYLQIALETGLIGLGVVVLLWLVALFWCLQGIWSSRHPQTGAAIAVSTAALLISLVHSVTDFVWYVPACVNTVLLFAVCAWRISLMRFSENASESAGSGSPKGTRFAWMAMAPLFAGIGIWMVTQKLPELAGEPLWHEYLRLSMSSQKSKADDLATAETLLKRRIQLAIDAAAADPTEPRMQLHAGLACLKRFALFQMQSENPMPLGQIREAARAAFSSKEEMDAWLDKPGVLGEGRQHLERARSCFQASLRACPLQPRPYLELAELAWLEGASEEQERQFIQQAVAVRPYDARSQFAMGTNLWTRGEMEPALKHWQEAFRLDANYRGHLIDTLALYVPAQFFLENFQPDFESLKQMKVAYAESTDRQGYGLIVQNLSKSAVKSAMKNKSLSAVEDWLLAHECFVELGDLNSAYRAAKEAINSNPSSYKAHLTLGLFLYNNGAWKEAVGELKWCQNRRPDVDWLQHHIETAFLAAERGVMPTDQVAEQPAGFVTR
ncbi:MAG: O-antigen ligase family protein [Planctomycetaceae bacterium]|nr:O-antigen ligase family protein [Planctomycetaceae bacterium]